MQLLDAGYDAAGPRRVGRTPKAYRIASSEIAVSLPARRHEVLAEILLDAVLAARLGGRADAAALRIAKTRGKNPARGNETSNGPGGSVRNGRARWPVR